MIRLRTNTIVIHGAWTPSSMDIGAAEIDQWHRERGFDRIGYHYVIRRDGTVERGRQQDQVGAHAQGDNDDSVGICLVGGKDVRPEWAKYVMAPDDAFVQQELAWEMNYTMEQMSALDELLGKLLQDYPQVTEIIGHRDLPGVTKRCPGFDVRAVIGSPQAVLDRVYGGE